MDEFDLKKYNTTQEGRRRLIPAINNCRKAILAHCNLTVESCKIIASALKSSKSPLRELDVSNNDLQDSGVKLISDALRNPNCQLEILRLSGCMVTDEGCCYLASALSSNPSHLKELDLSYNHPEHSALQLHSYQNDPDYALNILNLDHSGHFRIIPGLKKYACTLTLDPNTAYTHLILSENNRKAVRDSCSVKLSLGVITLMGILYCKGLSVLIEKAKKGEKAELAEQCQANCAAPTPTAPELSSLTVQVATAAGATSQTENQTSSPYTHVRRLLDAADGAPPPYLDTSEFSSTASKG
ncbi:hypothetical protein QQF64_034035 [Cirrhinus molitorella]|uniref:Uncharacterized protein n=1 Tax=Cirrhinus molitorella TaxID=172907 RepID=A0ABR3MVN7_9TELE